MAPTYKEHFTWQQLSPVHDVPTLFVVSQWQPDKSEPHILFLIYRTLLAAFLVTTWALSLDGRSYWIYLTNWGYTLCTLQALFAFVLVLCSVILTKILDNPEAHVELLRLHSMYWITHSAAVPIGFIITVIFWSVLYSSAMGFPAINFFVHGSNSIVLMIDLLIVAHPVRIVHCIYPILFGIAYLIFSIAYYYYDTNRGGIGYVYEILDWNKPGPTIGVVIGILIFIICLHILTFALHKLKMIIHDKMFPENARSPEIPTQSTEQLNVV